MKRVVSVSLGSSRRNHSAETEILGEKFKIERIGTDGDMEKAIALIKELDGQVDAFGMGGIDLYIHAGGRRYTFRDAKRIAEAARLTPIVDGSGLKNTLERRVVEYLHRDLKLPLQGKKVLMVCAVDRFGMAEALVAAGCQMVFGDLIFALGLPIPITSLHTLDRLARIVAPLISKLPFKYVYPTGNKQETITPRYTAYYHAAEIIAGDYLFIKKYMPERLTGKIILTNTVTKEDLEMLKSRGAKMLITTTPELNGRSFGTNVMEGVLVALLGKPVEEIKPEDYDMMLAQIAFKPRIEELA